MSPSSRIWRDVSWALQISGWPASRCSLALARDDDALAHGGGRRRGLAAQRLGGRALDAHQDVDAVQQRAREAAAMAGEVRLGAAGSACRRGRTGTGSTRRRA